MINQTSDPNAPTLIAEGVVTGLSLAQSIPNANVRIVLGKKLFTSIDPAVLTQKTIFCLDNDGENLKTDKAILEAANRLRTNKKDVSFMVPTVLDMQKQDYNDILKQKGSRAIQADFQHAVSYEDFYKNLSISQQKLAQLSREIAKETALKDNARLLAYQAITANKQEVALDKTLPKIKETSREI